MSRSLDRWLVIALGLVSALLVVSATVAYRNTRQMHEDAYWVAHTNEVLDSLDGLLSTMTDAETGERGFLITGDERYLEPYRAALAAVNGRLERVERLTIDNDRQQARIPHLRELVQAKIDGLAAKISLRKEAGFEAAQHEVSTDLGKTTMDAIRALVAEMQDDERGLLQSRQEANDRAYSTALVSGTLGALMGLAAVVAFIWLLRLQWSVRLHAETIFPEHREWFRMGEEWPSAASAYTLAVAATAAVVLLRWLMDPWMGSNLPFVTMFGAVAAAVWYGGYRCALVTTALGYLACDYLFIEPRGSFIIHGTHQYIGSVLYLITCSILIGFGEGMRLAQNRARGQREWFRTTLASIGDAVIATDTEARVTFLNSVAQSLTGWKQEEAKGKLLETVFKIVNEETRMPVVSPVQRALEEGRIVGLANHTLLVSRTGEEYPIDDSAAPIRGRNERIAGVVLVFRDITARKQQEREGREQVEQLAEAEERVRSVVDNVIDGIVTIDEQGLVRSFNLAAQKLFGYEAEELVGQNVRVLMPAPYHDEHDSYIGNYLSSGVAKIIGIGREVEGRRKDGSVFPMELAVSAFRLNEQRYFTGIVRDITDRKRNEKQTYDLLLELKEADRRKDEFLATLAHELRGPLAPLTNMLEIMKLADRTDDHLRQARSTMERQLGQLVRLVEDLLDVSRITRNRLELRKERIELASIVDQAVEISRPLAESSGHAVTVHRPEEPIFVDGDLVRLVQVFSNLLSNSCKYTEPGGRIGLTAERQGSDVVVTVQDNGVGIPREMLPHVFEMFVQVDCTLERSQGGLGIGLTLVKQLVELHGGTVEASSDGPGLGSTFVVRLPILIGAPERPRPSRLARSAPVKAHRILVVDDNKDSATSLAILLTIAGNETRSAYDGLEALQTAETFRPDVVLLDIGLPKLNGYDVARKIRGRSWGKDILLVALTGWGHGDDRCKSKDAGFDHHMVKPVDYSALMDLLASSSAAHEAS